MNSCHKVMVKKWTTLTDDLSAYQLCVTELHELDTVFLLNMPMHNYCGHRECIHIDV